MSLSIILLSCANVASRSSLNVIDRFVFGRSKTGFLQLYFFTNALPLVLGFFILAFLKTKVSFWSYFLTLPCALWALSTHLVGMSFSYAFRHCEVRQVVIKAKIPEVLFAFTPFIFNTIPSFSSGLKTYASLTPTLIGLILIWLKGGSKKIPLFDRVGFYIISSLLIQMICVSSLSISADTLEGGLLISVAMLLWRCCLMLPFLYTSWKKEQNVRDEAQEPVQDSKGQFSRISGVLIFRAVLALATQLTFTWCVLKGPPLLIWPIFNTTPLVASIAAQLILKEYPHWSEVVALLCFFLGSTCTVFL
jgi:hypothetical protein